MVIQTGIQKVTATQPKFTVSLERRILVKPNGDEIDMFLQQNEIAAAVDSTNPKKVIDLTLPVTEATDIIGTYFGGTVLDDLDVSTAITAVKVKDVQFDAGDILPDADGYLNRSGAVATATETHDVWFRTNISFAPSYGGPNSYQRTVTMPIQIQYKDANNGGAVTTLNAVISGSMNKNRFNIVDFNSAIEEIQLTTKLDTSNAMIETVKPKWEVTTDIVEIPNATPIAVTISPQETKDISAMYNVNQVTKQMELIKTTLGEYKDMTIYKYLEESYNRLDDRNGFHRTFDLAPRTDYALSHIEYRHAVFMDMLDNLVTKMLQVLNDPNMTVSIFGDPNLVRKITPKEYAYNAPSAIGPVTLDYTQTIVNVSDKRVYNFVGSDKMRNTDQLLILLNPNNSEHIIYRIYDYQMYISNEIRSITNPALPALYSFERFKMWEYFAVQARVDAINVDYGVTE